MTSKAYAGTEVSVERTKEQLRQLLIRHKIEQLQFVEDWKMGLIGVAFVRTQVTGGKTKEGQPMAVAVPIRFTLPIAAARMTRSHYREAQWGKRERQVWRALYYYTKARLEAVEFGLETLTDAFMAHIVTGDGRTLGDHVRGHLSTGTLALPSGVVS
jgi:ribosomal protein S6E (S10)